MLDKRIVFLLFAACLVAGAGACDRAKPAAPGEPVIDRSDLQQPVLLGPRTTLVLGEPTRVRAYRILSPFDPQFGAAQKKQPLIREYPIVKEVPVPPNVAARIAKLLVDPKSYDPDYAMTCLFDPHHALRFERGADAVDVILCFECGDLSVVPSASLREQGTTQPFGRIAKPLYKVIAEVLPEERNTQR